MSERLVTRIAVGSFVLGLGLVFLVDLGVARIVGVPLIFVGILFGVRAVASPGFLEADSPEDG